MSMRFVALVCLASCGDSADVVVEDVGTACMRQLFDDRYADTIDELAISPSDTYDYEPGRSLVVAVTDFVAADCEQNVVASCSLDRSGRELRVHFDASYDTTGACTREARFYRATCMTDGLPSGEYELVLGDARTTFAIPSVGNPPCVREAP